MEGINDYFTAASEKKYKIVTAGYGDVGAGISDLEIALEKLRKSADIFAERLASLESTSIFPEHLASLESTNIFAEHLASLESTNDFKRAFEKARINCEFVCVEVVTVVYGDVGAGKSNFMNALAAGIFPEHLASLESTITLPVTRSEPNNLVLISGVYDVDPRDNKGYSRVLKIEHCALQEFGNQWQLEVKCRPKGSKASSGRWTNIRNIYPDATVKVKQNYIELTLPTVEDSHEFAVFGTPEVKDKKRMRLGIFGGKATRGQDWNIVGTLFDDTMMAFESLCEKEERKGRQLLTILPGLFISNSGEDIKIDISGLEEGWKIIGNSLMTIKSKDAWNSPENSTDFPCCVFEITHVDEAKQLFSCQIKASHLNDSAETELVAFFEQANEVMTRPELPIQENNVFDLFVFLQMLVFFVECFTGSSFDPQAPKKGSVADQVENLNSN